MKVFVFGSNTSGWHGKGAALEAIHSWGAIYGVGSGFMNKGTEDPERGCYALPTKDSHLRTLPLVTIQESVKEFLFFAKTYPHWDFLVTRVGCGLAGYHDTDIAPFFEGASDNCQFDPAWVKFGLKTWLTLEDLIETNPQRL